MAERKRELFKGRLKIPLGTLSLKKVFQITVIRMDILKSTLKFLFSEIQSIFSKQPQTIFSLFKLLLWWNTLGCSTDCSGHFSCLWGVRPVLSQSPSHSAASFGDPKGCELVVGLFSSSLHGYEKIERGVSASVQGATVGRWL